ncbi:MAG: GAF domain-containing sensor histidine kinase [Chloroflexota bacterium]
MRPRYNATSTLRVLKEIAETLNRGVSLPETLDVTLPLVVELLGLHTGWLFLRDDEGAFEVAAHHNLPPALSYPGEPWNGLCNCQALARKGELSPAGQVVECSRLREASGDRQGLAYHASMPLMKGDQLLGIMNLATSDWDTFTPQDLQVISAVGYQIAATVERIRLAEQAMHMARVEERNRLARDVHDTLAQELAGIALQLEAADALLEVAPQRARERIRQALARTRESLEEARRSVLELRGGPLERGPLGEALQALARRVAEESGLQVTADIGPDVDPVPARVAEALYRIAQEGLANTRKHARAQSARITLRREGGRLALSVADDGRGIEASEPPEPGQGFGLIGMRERAHLIGGTLEVRSAPGSGTVIEVIVPAEHRAEAAGGRPEAADNDLSRAPR